MILCGDIGATKSLLGLVERVDGARFSFVRTQRYTNSEWPDLPTMLDHFFAATAQTLRHAVELEAAGFGVAGPVIDGRVDMTNLEWSIDEAALRIVLGGAPVRLLNDFEASAHGIGELGSDGLLSLQTGAVRPGAPQLVIGAGSGLGVALRVPAGAHCVIVPGEGGHVGFTPANEEQAELWAHLHRQSGRVIAEQIVSGPGLVRIHNWLCDRRGTAVRTDDNGEAVWRRAAAGDLYAMRALDVFVDCYGAVAGDHALTVLAGGGVFLTGGIAPQLLPAQAARFLAAFHDKGRHSGLMAELPLWVVTDCRLPLLGAARAVEALLPPR
jgi:glucokinase